MLIKSVKNKDYGLLANHIKINMEQGYIVSRLKNACFENFYFNQNDKMWYFKNYKKDIKLINILYPDKNILEVQFKNNDHNDYLPDNLVLKLDPKFENSFIDPPNYYILADGTSVLIKEGSCAGEYRNMYWKVRDNLNNTYYLMHIKDDLYTKISKRDINKVLTFFGNAENKINFRPTWRLFSNGYVACTINNQGKQKVYYLHQLVMDVHDEDLTNYEKTVDHINQDKLDNRRKNLRLVNMSIQNSNRDKAERRCDACELPDGLTQSDLPKFIVYRKEILDKDTGKSREYFYIDSHPKLEKRWETSKSNNVSIKEKLKQAKLKLQQIEEIISDAQYNKQSGAINKLDLPVGIRLSNSNDKLIYDYRNLTDRYTFQMALKSPSFQDDLDLFIDKINEKYPELKLPKYQTQTTIKSNNKTYFDQTDIKEIKLELPPNFSFYYENKVSSYYFSFNKSIDGTRLNTKTKIKSNQLQKEFNEFMLSVKTKYPNVEIKPYTIPNIDQIKLFNDTNIIDNNDNKIDNLAVTKPIMPMYFSLCNVHGVDYIQFGKTINHKRYMYKQKINSYDLNSELDRFIDELNRKYNLKLDKSQCKISNPENWKTTNKIVDHIDNEHKQALRASTQRYNEKKKQTIGIDEFRKLKAQYSRDYREKQLDITV